MFFSCNVINRLNHDIGDVLGFIEADENSHYLGLPNFIGRKKSVMLGHLKEGVMDRVNKWDGKILPKGGKEK